MFNNPNRTAGCSQQKGVDDGNHHCGFSLQPAKENHIYFIIFLMQFLFFLLNFDKFITSALFIIFVKEANMPTTGEKPGKGTYKCRNCGTTVTLDDDSDRLPPCPSCDGTEFDKIS